MTRTLGAGITSGIALAVGESTELLFLDFADTSNNPTPVYLTTAAKDISWNSQTWQAVGGHLAVDVLGESTDGPADGVRLALSGVDQSVLALILGSRWRGRTATAYYAHLDQALGTVKTDPVLMFKGLMNGGFDISESRGDFGGGTVDIALRLTAKLNELVKVRGVRTNMASHRATIPGASTDTFFQHVPQLALRRVYWGMKTPGDTTFPGPGTPGVPAGHDPWHPGGITPTGPGGDPFHPGGIPPKPAGPGGIPTPFAPPGSNLPGSTPPTVPPPSIDPGRTVPGTPGRGIGF